MKADWQYQLSRAILLRMARDCEGKGLEWLAKENIVQLCEQGKVDYAKYIEAMRFLHDKTGVERAVLLQRLTAHLK